MLIKILALAIYVLILFLIGYFASKRINSMEDYYVGGKKIGYWAVAFSARATGESGWLLIGLTGMGAIAGYTTYWVVVGEVLGVAVSWFLMAKKFKIRSDKLNSITITDYLVDHFGSTTKTLRILSASVLAIFTIIYVSTQIDATGVAFESMLGVNYFAGALIGFAIVMLYIFIGGYVAVVWSDLFQGLLMFFGLVLLPIVAWFTIKENGSLTSQLSAIDPSLISFFGTSSDPLINFFTILGFSMIGLGFLGSPQVYVRFMSIRSVTEIDHGKWVAIIFTLLTDAAAVTIGVLARIYFTSEGQEPESILGVGGKDVLAMMTESFLPLILVAIYVAIVLSAIMSTIDSLLVVASSAITRDFYQKIINPDIKKDALTRLSRLVTLGMALLALALSIIIALTAPDRQVFWVIIFGWSGIAASFCPVIILTLFYKRFTEKAAIASMLTGFLCVPLFKFVFQVHPRFGSYFEAMDVLLPSFVIAIFVGLLVSKLTSKKGNH